MIVLDLQLALLMCSISPLVGAQHVPSGKAPQPGAHWPGALPQVVHTAPGSPLALSGGGGGEETAQ